MDIVEKLSEPDKYNLELPRAAVGAIGDQNRTQQYLGTVLQFNDLPPEKLNEILERSFAQPILSLFELVRRPEEVPGGVFGFDDEQWRKRFRELYIQDRVGVGNLRETLYQKLLESNGKLIVQSRAGLGKTHELAVLAEWLCDREGWTVCVARDIGDHLIEQPDFFPDEFRNEKLLFIFDSLQERIDQGSQEHEPYLTRLGNFGQYFYNRLASGEIYIILAARSEAKYKPLLELEKAHPFWEDIETYTLPEFTVQGLEKLLAGMAEWAGIEVDSDQVKRMVADCDGTAKTIVENVELSRRRRRTLNLESWLPSQGKTWSARLVLARHDLPHIEQVKRAFFLFRKAGLPTRATYITRLGSLFAESEVSASLQGLLDIGLFRSREGLLSAPADLGWEDHIPEGHSLNSHWETITQIVIEQAADRTGWEQDISNLLMILWEKQEFGHVEAAADQAIRIGHRKPYPYVMRGIARFTLKKYLEAEEDLTKAISLGLDISGVYTILGLSRFNISDQSNNLADRLELLGNAQQDLSVAIDEFGEMEVAAFKTRGIVNLFLGNEDGALEDLEKAIELGDQGRDNYFILGLLKTNRENYPGAKEGMSTAIKLGLDDSEPYLWLGYIEMKLGNLDEAEKALTEAIKREQDEDDARLFFLRCELRIRQKDYSGALKDIRKAIELGEDSIGAYITSGALKNRFKDFTGAVEDFRRLIEINPNDNKLYFYRGATYFNAGSYARAIADLNTAIRKGMDESQAYLVRGFAFHRCGRDEQASDDFEKALARGAEQKTIDNFLQGGEVFIFISSSIESKLRASFDLKEIARLQND